MWSLTKNIIFVYIYLNIGFSSADYDCENPGDDFNAEPADVPLPVDIVKVEQNDTTIFQIDLQNVTESVTFTLYVNPFKRDPNDCVETPKNTRDLYEFFEPTELSTAPDRNRHTFSLAPTGCYYVKLTNKRRQNFIVPITYYNGTSEFHDWIPKCKKSEVQPPTSNTRRKFNIELEMPLQCANTQMKLFEIEKATENETISKIRRGLIPPIGECWFTIDSVSCNSNETGFTITRKLNISKENEHWMANIEWTKLKNEGGYYYSTFFVSNKLCRVKYMVLNTWIPAYRLELLYHGLQNTSGIPRDHPEGYSYTVILSLSILVGLFVIVMIIYFISMCIKIHPKREINVSSCNHEIEERLYIDKILLIYMQSTSNFMEYVQDFKNELKKRFKHEVYDIYSKCEYPAIATRRPHAWVERIMKDGCKVIWIDTPEFRSYLTNRSKLNSEEEKNCIEMDFRDSAIKYALELTKSSIKDSDIQYMCHFVVRIDGLDFTDEADDPLSIITPHRRFYIPQHFERLCADLEK